MNNLNNMRNNAQYHKDAYPPGTRIELISMEDPFHPVPSGTKGTVTFVDDMGTIHMKWDNGRTLALIPNQDQFRKIKGQELSTEDSLEAKINQAANRSPESVTVSNQINEVQR